MIYEIYGVPASGKTVAAKVFELYGVKLAKMNIFSCRYIFTKEFFSFSKLVFILPSARYPNSVERTVRKAYLLYSYLNAMKERRKDWGASYLFSGIFEQMGGYIWYEDDVDELVIEIKKHIKKYMCGISFVYMKLPDAEKAYKRMMNRKGKVSLCKLDPKEAIQVIERLNAFFDEISKAADAKVFQTNVKLAHTQNELREYVNDIFTS